jgi:FMN-dependent dehydrogenase
MNRRSDDRFHVLRGSHGGCRQPVRRHSWLFPAVFRARLGKDPASDMAATVALWAQLFGNPLTWDDLPWLCSLTTLPLIVKGICHPDDVRRAKDGGVDGIYCSTHGGWQADGGLPALDCLPAVVDAADGVPVLFDSGVSSGQSATAGGGAARARVSCARPVLRPDPPPSAQSSLLPRPAAADPPARARVPRQWRGWSSEIQGACSSTMRRVA